jgi:beta-mannosidase
MNGKLYFFILILTSYSLSAQNITTELKANWQFRRQGDVQWMRANVPGTVHTDLLLNKKIPDPFYRDNEQKLQWIEKENWEYEADFDIDDKIISKQNIDLVFNGLDTYADVYLNGVLILQADNMFRTWKVDVKKYLRPRNNQLHIRFASAQNKVDSMAKAALPFLLPDNARVYVRKAQYHFGWDWGPKFTTCGVWRKIGLEAWDDVRIEDVYVRDFIIDSFYRDNKLVTFAQVETEITINSWTDKIYNLSLSEAAPADASGNIRRAAEDLSTEKNFVELLERVYIKKGRNRYSVVFGIRNPELWWCTGLGKQKLYQLACDLYDAANVHAEAKEHFVTPFALRKIELVTEPDDKSQFASALLSENRPTGKTFYFKVNGVPVFMKGANYIPQSPFLPSVTISDYRQVIENAKAANMNMLRVWGGGVYEDDTFYKLCDENGILVWQDLMFACAMYPGHEDFMESVRAELEQNIERLRNHPAIAVWCGNNENNEAWNNWGWQNQFNIHGTDSVKIWQWYEDLFHKLAPQVITDIDGARPYWPSSPSFGWGRNESYTEGDSHYWGLWHGNKEGFDIETIDGKTGRFVSEYGMQSLPAWSTIEAFTKPEDRDTSTVVMKAHQKNTPGFYKLGSYIDRYFNKPKDFESYAYVTQCLQAYTLKYSIETQRSKMPYCMGTLYWQLNDCWPVASWSSVDGSGSWKAAHYAIRNAYKDLLFGVSKNQNNFNIYMVNDNRDGLSKTLKISLADFEGKLFWQKNIDLKKIPWGKTALLTIDSAELFKGISAAKAVMQFSVTDASGEFGTSNLIYFARPKEQQLQAPRFTIRQPDATHLDISSDILARYVWVQIPGIKNLDDNFFDLMPGETMRIEIKTSRPLKNLLKQVKIRSLADTFTPAPEVPVQ